MFWKLSVGFVLAFLIGCGDYGTQILEPDADGNADTARVGETHRLEAFAYRHGGMTDSQSFDCDDAKVSSSDESIIDVELTTRSVDVETDTADDVAAAVALYHAIAPGTADITFTCSDRSSTISITVLP